MHFLRGTEYKRGEFRHCLKRLGGGGLLNASKRNLSWRLFEERVKCDMFPFTGTGEAKRVMAPLCLDSLTLHGLLAESFYQLGTGRL